MGEDNDAFAKRMKLKREGFDCHECGASTMRGQGAHDCSGIPRSDRLGLESTPCSDKKILCAMCSQCETCSLHTMLRGKEEQEGEYRARVGERVIDAIVERAMMLSLKHEMNVPKGDLFDAIVEVHGGGCPLRLGDLLKAADFDFGHDVFGILKHLDPGSGGNMGSFLPRFAA